LSESGIYNVDKYTIQAAALEEIETAQKVAMPISYLSIIQREKPETLSKLESLRQKRKPRVSPPFFNKREGRSHGRKIKLAVILIEKLNS